MIYYDKILKVEADGTAVTKNTGKVTVKAVNSAGKEYTHDLSVTTYFQKPKVKLTSPSKKKIKAKLTATKKDVVNMRFFEVQRATDKKFTKNVKTTKVKTKVTSWSNPKTTFSKTIKGLKSKKGKKRGKQTLYFCAMAMSFDDIRRRNLLIYEYIRGQHCHGISTPQSDIDHGGVYLAPPEQILGLGLDYKPLVESASHDDVWFELTRFMQLLLKSNPTILEALFVPDRCVVYQSDIITELKKHRDKFVTKQCFNPFGGYAVAQIKKARGLNKKIVNPVTHRLTPLDFCYTFYKQGSTELKPWLQKRGLRQQK